MTEKIRLSHGFGGSLSQELLDEIIYPPLASSAAGERRDTLDAAVFQPPAGPLAFSTDSFTVQPIFFPGGDIGKLAVAGTVNDLAVSGARPLYLSLSLIIEEGFPVEDLRRIMDSLGTACRSAGVSVITGDTKVVESGSVDGIFINTAGVGAVVRPGLGPGALRVGDSVLVSGTLGDHGAAILSAREKIGSGLDLMSDCAHLSGMILSLLEQCGDDLHALRDPTRGGLAAVMNEFARDGGVEILLYDEALPVRPAARDFLEILGMDPLLLANEGKVVLFCAPEAEDKVLRVLRSHPEGKDAAAIGRVIAPRSPGRVLLETEIGTKRILHMPVEPGLPRIC